MSDVPPYQESGYDSDEQEAIMEAGAAVTCAQCGKQFKSAHALRIHEGRTHIQKPAESPAESPSNGSVDQLVHELALALLDQALDELRTKMRAAL